MQQLKQVNYWRNYSTLNLLLLALAFLIACNGNKKSDRVQETKQTKRAAQPKTDSLLPANETALPATADTLVKLQDLEIFDLEINEAKPTHKFGFISLSDVYQLSEHPDSVAIPDLENKTFEEAQYLKLSAGYRQTFLAKTEISETDKVFIYDYAADVLASVPVSSLNTIAILSGYKTADDWPFTQNDFMIGFEIKPEKLKQFGPYFFNHTLVYIGKNNPFVRGQIKPIKWKAAAVKDFPVTPTDARTYAKLNANLRESGYNEKFSITDKQVLPTVHKYEFAGYQVFVKSFSVKHPGYKGAIARRLLVLKSDTKEVVCEDIIIESEGSSPTALNGVERKDHTSNYQWAGNLFKNKPPVIFGFAYYSFGCQNIQFLSRSEPEIIINCDNRH